MSQQKKTTREPAELPPPELPSLKQSALQAGRVYRIVFNDGKAMNVVLVDFDKYHLIGDSTDEEGNTRRLMIFKHAIKYVVLGTVTKET